MERNRSIGGANEKTFTINYAFNNPINFIDPDGMKALPPQEPVQNFMPPGGLLAYYAAGGRGNRASVMAFLGLNDHLSSAVFDVGYPVDFLFINKSNKIILYKRF